MKAGLAAILASTLFLGGCSWPITCGVSTWFRRCGDQPKSSGRCVGVWYEAKPQPICRCVSGCKSCECPPLKGKP